MKHGVNEHMFLSCILVNTYKVHLLVIMRDFIPRGCPMSEMGNTGVPMICIRYYLKYVLLLTAAVYLADNTWYGVRRCDFDCCGGRENVVVI